MTQLLETIFGELGITQYLDAFLEQGFDTWETILDITESDLDALGVKLGHRRKLQRRIANFRGIAPDAALVSPAVPSVDEHKSQDAVKTESPRSNGRETVGVVVTKRKYRRHPKPDENAPERPPSAYVLFSNKMREELRGRNLSFSEIAKLVGENWQSLSPTEKEPFESHAQAMKEKYLKEIAEYKKTPEYRQYQAYLREFKAKHGCPSQEKDSSKRVKLEPGSQSRASPGATPVGRTSRSGSGADSRRGSEQPSGSQKVDSAVSTGGSQHPTLAPSASMTSPGESASSPVAIKVERRSSELSPTFAASPRDPTSAPGSGSPIKQEDRSPEPLSIHRHHLPSISDIFDDQKLPGLARSSNETNTFHFGSHVGSPGPHPSHPGGNTRPPPPGHDQHFAGNISTPASSAFSHTRASIDGPLPIHALLAPKPEPAFEPSRSPQSSPSRIESKSRFAQQTQSGIGLAAINGYHSVPSTSQPPLSIRFDIPSFSAQPAPPPLVGLPQQSRHNASLDGMSALLKAGEIVGRQAQ